MAPDYTDYRNLALARLRAQKWLAELFKPANFGAIMAAVDPKTANSQTDFTTACTNAGMKPEEITWLWNYLEHCEKNLYTSVPEAASSGW